MGFLYLVGFKGQPYGHEDDVNYALRELLEEHCSYCTRAGRTEVFGPDTPKQSLAEICWLLREIGYAEGQYHDLIDHLREKHEKVKGYKPASWFDTFYGRDVKRQEREEQNERVDQWRPDSVFLRRQQASLMQGSRIIFAHRLTVDGVMEEPTR